MCGRGRAYADIVASIEGAAADEENDETDEDASDGEEVTSWAARNTVQSLSQLALRLLFFDVGERHVECCSNSKGVECANCCCSSTWQSKSLATSSTARP